MKTKYISNSLKLYIEKCIGCEKCTYVCPHAVFEIKNNKAVIINKTSCIECGACKRNCPKGAILVESGTGCAAAIILQALIGKKITGKILGLD